MNYYIIYDHLAPGENLLNQDHDVIISKKIWLQWLTPMIRNATSVRKWNVVQKQPSWYDDDDNVNETSSVPLSVFLQRSSEDRSGSSWTPEEDPDQCSVDEAQHRWPVSYGICVTTEEWYSTKYLTSVQSERAGCHLFTRLFYPHSLLFTTPGYKPLYMFLNHCGCFCGLMTTSRRTDPFHTF